MSVSASIAVSPTVATNGQALNVTLTITATPGTSAVSVVRVTPYVSGATGGGSASAGKGMAHPLAANGQSALLSASATDAASLPFNWRVNCYAPPSPLNPPYPNSPAYDTYTVGALADLSDGTVQSASTTVYVYPQTQDSTLVPTAMPGPGQLRFDSNLESGLLAAMSFPH